MAKRNRKPIQPREDGILTAAFYGRVSSPHQKVEESIEQQRDHCYRWAAQNGYKIVEEFIDEAFSGRREDRPQFNLGVGTALSTERPFDAIVAWNSARIARNTLYALVIREQLKENGVRLVMLNIPIDEDHEEMAALIIPMIHATDEVASIRMSTEIRRAQRARVSKGEYIGSTPPTGYLVHHEPLNGIPSAGTHKGRKTFRTLVIDPEWAPIIRRIFQDYNSGKAADSIRVQLDAEGIRSPKEKFWSTTVILRILSNVAYKGTLAHAHTDKAKKFDPILIDNAFEEIVPNELWDDVQEKIKERAPHKTRETARNHPLTGLIKCAKCGGPMKRNGKDPETAYYYCKNRDNPEPYRRDAPGVLAGLVERRVIQAVIQKILSQEHIDELISILESETAEENQRQRQNLETIEQQLEKNIQEKSNLLRFVRQNEILNESMIASELADLQKQQDDLLNTKIREEVEFNRRKQIVSGRDKIKAFAKTLRAGIATGDLAKTREVLRTVCKRVTAKKGEYLTIEYRIPVPPRHPDFNGRTERVPLTGPFLTFDTAADSREKVESWRNYYNGERPHSALGNLSPREFDVLAEIGD